MVVTPEDFSRIPALFAEARVRIVFLEAFPGSKMDGCSFLLDDGSPAIAISGRGKQLLFTILHESAPILLNHVNADPTYIIDDKTAKPTLGPEGPADQQAALWVPFLVRCRNLPERISERWITSVAQIQGVHPLVLIGHLQWKKAIPWRTTLVRDAPSVISQLQDW
jgi:HTH-type transcriptional regulator / antitoxin HigA